MEFHEFLYGVGTTEGNLPDSDVGHSRIITTGLFTYRANWKLFNRKRMLVGREEATSSGREWACHAVGRIASDFKSSSSLRLHEIYAFAHGAKKQVDLETPFRGPVKYTQKHLEYQSVCKGDLEHFESNDTVFFRGKPVFRINFQGGFIRNH